MSIDARIEYVTTDDGVSLACTKFGSGPGLIYQFGNPSSSHFEMELAGVRLWDVRWTNG